MGQGLRVSGAYALGPLPELGMGGLWFRAGGSVFRDEELGIWAPGVVRSARESEEASERERERERDQIKRFILESFQEHPQGELGDY